MYKIKSHYDNLQVQESASIDVIKGAYKHLIQKWHPDKHPNDRLKAERITTMLNDAFNVLSDPVKRKQHDEWIATQRHDEKQKNESKASAGNSNENKHNQDAGQQSYSENVSNNDGSLAKTVSKQYTLLFIAATVGLALVCISIYGGAAIGPFVKYGTGSPDYIAVVLGSIIGVAFIPLLLMKFAGNKAGWIALMFCLVFSYFGKIKHLDNTGAAYTTVAPNSTEAAVSDIESVTAVEAAADAVAVADNAIVAEPNSHLNNAKLSQIFTRDMLSSNIPYLEQITGPPRRIIPYSIEHKGHEYIVGGCEVDVEAYNGQISSLALVLSNKCSLDLNQFLAPEENNLHATKNMTFGQFYSLHGGVFLANCLIGCGNAYDPSVYLHYTGSRAENVIEVMVEAAQVDNSALFAADKWQDAMVQAEGEDWVWEKKFNCTPYKYNEVAIKALRDVKVQKITIGYHIILKPECEP